MVLNKYLINKNIKMLVFDMAGTTVNEGGIVYKTLYNTIKNYNLQIENNEINKWHGYNKYEVLDHFLAKKFINEEFKYHQSILHKEFNNNLILNYSNNNSIKLMDENMPQLFNEFRDNGIKICLNTG